MPLPEGVRIGEARHVSSWGNPDGANPDRNACHVSSGGGVPTGMRDGYVCMGMDRMGMMEWLWCRERKVEEDV